MTVEGAQVRWVTWRGQSSPGQRACLGAAWWQLEKPDTCFYLWPRWAQRLGGDVNPKRTALPLGTGPRPASPLRGGEREART